MVFNPCPDGYKLQGGVCVPISSAALKAFRNKNKKFGGDDSGGDTPTPPDPPVPPPDPPVPPPDPPVPPPDPPVPPPDPPDPPTPPSPSGGDYKEIKGLSDAQIARLSVETGLVAVGASTAGVTRAYRMGKLKFYGNTDTVVVTNSQSGEIVQAVNLNVKDSLSSTNMSTPPRVAPKDDTFSPWKNAETDLKLEQEGATDEEIEALLSEQGYTPEEILQMKENTNTMSAQIEIDRALYKSVKAADDAAKLAKAEADAARTIDMAAETAESATESINDLSGFLEVPLVDVGAGAETAIDAAEAAELAEAGLSMSGLETAGLGLVAAGAISIGAEAIADTDATKQYFTETLPDEFENKNNKDSGDFVDDAYMEAVEITDDVFVQPAKDLGKATNKFFHNIL
jgi:hypothetical protein